MLTDVSHLRDVLKDSAEFREILKNSAVSRAKQRDIFSTFAPKSYNEVTQNFIESMIEAGR